MFRIIFSFDFITTNLFIFIYFLYMCGIPFIINNVELSINIIISKRNKDDLNKLSFIMFFAIILAEGFIYW